MTPAMRAVYIRCAEVLLDDLRPEWRGLVASKGMRYWSSSHRLGIRLSSSMHVKDAIRAIDMYQDWAFSS